MLRFISNAVALDWSLSSALIGDNSVIILVIISQKSASSLLQEPIVHCNAVMSTGIICNAVVVDWILNSALIGDNSVIILVII